jgi:hypothetical protein
MKAHIKIKSLILKKKEIFICDCSKNKREDEAKIWIFYKSSLKHLLP